MYAQNSMMAGVSPGRMAEARRFAQGGQMGRAKQQFELGGGQWSPEVHGMLGQQDSIGQVMPDQYQEGMGGQTGPGMDIGGGPGWGFKPGQDTPKPGGPPQWGAFPGLGGGMGGGMAQPGFEPGGPDDPEMGGSGYMGGGRPGGGMGAFPNMPPRFRGRPPAGMGQVQRFGGMQEGMGGGMGRNVMQGGAFGGRPSAGPPNLRRRMSMY